MPYNPALHNRQSIRLKGYDYSQAGLYFITICCERRGNPLRLPFGHIENNEMVLNQYGKIAFDEWFKLSDRFLNFELDVFQIMPNHMHGIIVLNNVNPVGAGLAPAQNAPAPNDIFQNDSGIKAGASPAPTSSIPNIVGAYKSLVANECLKIFKSNNETMGKLWQRNYYEHIIRDDRSYQTIANYIINNPAKWQEDKFYQEIDEK